MCDDGYAEIKPEESQCYFSFYFINNINLQFYIFMQCNTALMGKHQLEIGNDVSKAAHLYPYISITGQVPKIDKNVQHSVSHFHLNTPPPLSFKCNTNL